MNANSYCFREEVAPCWKRIISGASSRSPAATAELLRRAAAQEPDNPIVHPVFAMALFYELHEHGERESAETLWPVYREATPEIVGGFVASAEFFGHLGGDTRTAYSRACLETVAWLDPENEKAAALRKEFGFDDKK